MFSDGKEYLHGLRRRITDWLAIERHLDVKANWQVFQLGRSRPLSFCGYLFYPHKTMIRKATKKRMINAMATTAGPKKVAMKAAYNGWLSFGSTRTLKSLLGAA